MNDDTKSTSASPARKRNGKQTKQRIYVVVNPNPNEEGDGHGPQQLPYVPPPLPNLQAHHGENVAHSTVYPGPINTDDLKQKYHPYYNTSDRTLSSPSTPTSSPAVESTPPPSTPGQKSVPSIDLTQGSDRSDGCAALGRGESIVKKITSPFSHVRRKSSGQSGSGTSPVNHELYQPANSRSTLALNKVLICATAESEDYRPVDITGARDAAFIRERIFSKLRISDDDQAHFSIYRTEIGSFALSDALTDEQLFNLCQMHGDSIGTLKFLVSYSSAKVHESLHESPLDLFHSQPANPLPPPVLPVNTYGPFSPVRTKRQSRSPQRSLSSTSERIPQEEGGTGYDASVSDDLENMDRDPNRATIRPSTYKNVATPPVVPPLRPHSPLNTQSQDRSRGVPSEVAPLRLDKGYANSAPLQPVSPNAPRLPISDDNSATTRKPSTTESAPERERVPEQPENKVENADQHWRLQEEKDKQRRRDGQQRRAQNESQKGKEHWTVVPSDVPHSDYKKERPLLGQDTPRSQSSRRVQGYGDHAFGSPRHPSEGRSRRPIGQPVPNYWAVAWRAPGGKGDQKVSPTLPSPLFRGIKSMENLRASAKHPPPLQPGKSRPPLPVSRPMTSNQDCSELASNNPPPLPKSYDLRNNIVSPVSGPSRPLPVAGYTSTFAGTSLVLTSPSADPYARPRSAMGESATLPFSKARPIQPCIYRSDADSSLNNGAASSPPAVLSPHHVGYSSSSRPAYAFEGSSNLIPRIVHSTQSSDNRGMDTTFRRGVANTTTRTPPSPISPSSPRYSASSEPSPAEAPRRLNSPIDSTTETSLKARYPWMTLDPQSTDGTIMPRKERSDIKPLPPHPQPRYLQGHPLSPPPPLPLPPVHSPSTTESSTLLFTSSSISTPVASTVIVPPYVPGSVCSPVVDDGSDSGSNEGGTLWAIGNDLSPPGTWQSSDKRKSTRGPPLTVQIEKPSGPQLTPGTLPVSTLPRLPDFAPPEYLPHSYRRVPKPPKTPTNTGVGIVQHPNRTSVFNEDFRPPPEEVYERLGDFFPEHDLDEPVIEASSGGTSPTSADHSVVPPLPQISDRRKHKKSIRVVANEHKRKLDRNSRSTAANVANNMLRKRSTKLWGSKVEEVTAEQLRDGLITSPESPGPKPIFKWVRGELIGRGTYGKVYVALNATTGEMIAVKQVEIPRTESDRNDTRQITVVEALKLESETLKDLDHPNIVQYLGFEGTPKFLSIFLEYVPGGSIGSCLRKHGRFDEYVTKSFTGQILDGLEYLHSKGILHRDLKADNILVESFGLCKISDFGISKRTDDIEMIGAYTSMQGSVFWMAPEVLNSHKKGYNSKIDIWSVGCVVFEMWTGRRPWSGQELVAVLLQLYQTKVGPPIPSDIPLSALADDFRKKCFAINPDERPSAAELKKHQYLILPPGWQFIDFV